MNHLYYLSGGVSESEPDYLKPCDLYSIKKSGTGVSITIVFTRKKDKTFSTFEDIIFKLYDKNLFLDYHYNKMQGKHNGIRYTFEIINGVEVNLTLYKSTQSLWIQGKGCERWFNESFSNLGKQLHEVYYFQTSVYYKKNCDRMSTSSWINLIVFKSNGFRHYLLII